MAFNTAILENSHTGQIRQAPMGYSWTMFFFGFFPPMFRGDWKWVAIVFFSAIAGALVSFGLLAWLGPFICSFVWNKSHINGLVSEGYRLRSVSHGDLELADGYVGYRIKRIAE